MNKTKLINAIAGETGISRVDSKKVLNAFLVTISNELKKNGKITLIGHGTYRVVERSARNGINPKTKEPIRIPAKKMVKFIPGAKLI